MHFDPQIQQLQVGFVITFHQAGHIHLVFVRHDEDAVTFLVGDEGIERDGSFCLFLSKEETAAVSGTCLEGEIARRADGDKLGFYGDFVAGFFISAAAFTGKRQPDYGKQHGAYGHLAHQLPHRYGSWSLHSGYKCSEKFWVFFNRLSQILINL